MAREIINNGTTAGDGTGEILFNAFEKCNNNFEELYSYATNATTTDLSLSDLDTAYPDASVGFKVFCEDIIITKQLYMKSGTGWIAIVINTVL